MAKAKKTAALTLEERLAQALVPEDEQPYSVPENWCWTRFFTVLNYEQPTEYIVESTEYKEEYSIPVLTAGKSFVLGYTDESLGICRDLPVIIFDDFTTDSKFVYFPFKVKSSAMKILRPATDIELKFIYFYMQTVNCDNSEHRRFWISTYSQLPFPIPPLAEQQRIVDRIESLFAKLDEAKEKVQAALDSFEARKAAILHKAFTGDLTAKWRKENGVGMDSWENKSLAMCGSLERGRSQHRPRNAPELFGGSYPFIQTGDVASANVYITQHKQTLSEIGLEQSRMFPKGTLCITIAANIGDVAILSYDSCFPDSVVGFTPNHCTDSKFVYYMMSVLQEILETEAPATAQKNINLKILNDVNFLCPNYPEQTAIVRLLDAFFAKEQKAKELCSVLDNIDLIKKSILARAFRGELGTNDPSEESAIELLKTVL